MEHLSTPSFYMSTPSSIKSEEVDDDGVDDDEVDDDGVDEMACFFPLQKKTLQLASYFFVSC